MQAPRLERGSNRREPTPLTSVLLRGSVCPPPPSGERATTPGPFKRATTRQERTPTHARYGFLKDLTKADYVGQAANYCGQQGSQRTTTAGWQGSQRRPAPGEPQTATTRPMGGWTDKPCNSANCATADLLSTMEGGAQGSPGEKHGR